MSLSKVSGAANLFLLIAEKALKWMPHFCIARARWNESPLIRLSTSAWRKDRNISALLKPKISSQRLRHWQQITKHSGSNPKAVYKSWSLSPLDTVFQGNSQWQSFCNWSRSCFKLIFPLPPSLSHNAHCEIVDNPSKSFFSQSTKEKIFSDHNDIRLSLTLFGQRHKRYWWLSLS